MEQVYGRYGSGIAKCYGGLSQSLEPPAINLRAGGQNSASAPKGCVYFPGHAEAVQPAHWEKASLFWEECTFSASALGETGQFLGEMIGFRPADWEKYLNSSNEWCRSSKHIRQPENSVLNIVTFFVAARDF